LRIILFILLILLQLQSVAQQITQVKVKDLEDGLNERIVNKIARDTFGFFYLFFNNSVQRYDGADFENVEIPIGSEQLLKNISTVTTDNNGGLMISSESNDQYIHIIAGALSSQYVISHDTDIIFPQNKLSFNGSSDTYVVRENDTIVARRGTFWKYQDGDLIQLGGIDNEGLNCNAMTQDNNGNIIAAYGYVANQSDAVMALSPDNEISDYSEVLDYNDKIRDIYCDDINHRWMIATFNGLYIVSFMRTGIDVYHVDENVSSSEFGYVVTTVSADGPDVLLADENYGLRRITDSGELETLFPNETVDFFNNEMIVYDTINNQYFITANYTDDESVLYICDTTFTDLRKQIIPFKVSDFLVLSGKELLLTGTDRTVSDDNTSGRAMVWNIESSSGEMVLLNLPILRTVELVDEHYWIGTTNGLFVFDQNYALQEKIESGITNPFILCLEEVGNQIYAGSYGGGLYVIDKDSKRVVRQYNKANFLSDNVVAAIQKDDSGNIWIGTFNGINVIDQSGHIISKLMGYDGISHREMNTNAISKDADGNIYFGTLNGMTKIVSEEVLEWSTSYGLHVENATAYYGKNGKVINVAEMPMPVESGYDSLLLRIVFPDYVKTLFDTPFNYLMINDHPTKVLSHDNRQVLLTPSDIEERPTLNLHNDKKTYHYTLTFDTKLDLTKWIIGLLVLLCILCLFMIMFYRWKVNKVFYEQSKKIETNKRVAELELSALQSQMNPHFIFNALGAIQYFIQTQKTEEADNFLADFALLMRKILESSKTKFITLREEKVILDLYVSLEQLRFEGLFDFSWHIDQNVNMEMIIPPMILQPFVENAINHGLYNIKDKKGKLDIYIDQKAHNIVECIVKDNGVGRKQSALLRNKKHKPRGMEIINERIKTLNSIKEIEIRIKTLDLYENNKPSGTTAIIEIVYNNLDNKNEKL